MILHQHDLFNDHVYLPVPSEVASGTWVVVVVAVSGAGTETTPITSFYALLTVNDTQILTDVY